MSLRNIGIVYRKELLDSVRERRTLISMVVAPLLLMPALTFGFGFAAYKLVGEARQEVPRVMVLGAKDSPALMGELKALKTIEMVPASPDYVDQISNKRIRAAVQVPPGFDAALRRAEPTDVLVYIYEGDIRSSFAAERVERFFRELRERTVRQRLETRNLPESLLKPFEISQKNVVPPEKVWGSVFGGLVTYMVILLSLTGAMYPAMDLTAGEKERGTMETILCSPVSRTHLVLGKFFTVLTASLATAGLSIFSMAMTILGAKTLLGGLDPQGPAMLKVTVNPKAVLAVFIMMLPIAVILSAGLLAIALLAKSFREAQTYISPLTIVVVMLAVIPALPGIELNTRLALLPIVNTSLVSKEIVTGTYHWKYIALIFASSCIYAALALGMAVMLFRREDVLFRA
ncbi:MAG TPA: ABC transporter permease [Candidatus Acidoferrales bacterium]|nr:ABC transporter permease [Candidatus Acidoferrales bacterium]